MRFYGHFEAEKWRENERIKNNVLKSAFLSLSLTHMPPEYVTFYDHVRACVSVRWSCYSHIYMRMDEPIRIHSSTPLGNDKIYDLKYSSFGDVVHSYMNTVRQSVRLL